MRHPIGTEVLPIHETLLAGVLKNVLQEASDTVAQPILVVGERGSGKTTFLGLLKKRLIEQGQGAFFPVYIESRSLFCINDLWRKCAEELGIDMITGSVYEEILDWQHIHSVRVVLLVDDIQYLFERTDNVQQYELRGKMGRGGAPVLIAASDKVDSGWSTYEAAFFDAFKISYVRPLDLKEVTGSIPEADQLRIGRLYEYMPKTIRSLLVCRSIVQASGDVARDIDCLIESFSPLYAMKYDGYVLQVQRLLNALCLYPEGLPLDGIRGETGQGNGKISPYLKMMVDRQILKRTSKSQRKTIYQIADPLFRLWLRSHVG